MTAPIQTVKQKLLSQHFTILYQHLMAFFMYIDLLITKGFFS